MERPFDISGSSLSDDRRQPIDLFSTVHPKRDAGFIGRTGGRFGHSEEFCRAVGVFRFIGMPAWNRNIARETERRQLPVIKRTRLREVAYPQIDMIELT